MSSSLSTLKIIDLRERKDLIPKAAKWFSDKWGIEDKLYIKELTNDALAYPRFYIVLDDDKIIAGIGVIENDFHARKDLKPNICALYVEKEYRNNGIAKALIDRVKKDMAKAKIHKLYLISEHKDLYEHMSFIYIGDIKDNDGIDMRIYASK